MIVFANWMNDTQRLAKNKRKKTGNNNSNKEQHVCLEIVQATDRVYVQMNI